jgi:hypothetical protein
MTSAQGTELQLALSSKPKEATPVSNRLPKWQTGEEI